MNSSVVDDVQPAPPVKGTQTAGRALSLLEAVVRSEGPVSISQLQRITGFNKSVVYRLMRELRQHDFVVRDESGRRYRVGSGTVALAALVLRGVNIRSAAHPVMVRLAEITSETVSLHVQHRHQRVCVNVVESHLPVKRAVPLGELLPLYAGPSGKAMLAFLDPAEIEQILREAAEAGGDIVQIRRQLEMARTDGYLALVGDRIPDVSGLTVPVFDMGGVAGALTVSGPAARFARKQMKRVAPLVASEAAALSRSLGAAPPLAATRSDIIPASPTADF
jgi:DNA-binding IclR family transcriptional regulator